VAVLTVLTEATMDYIYGGAYATEQEALDAKALRPEPQEQLDIVQDDYDPEHPWRIRWARPAEA